MSESWVEGVTLESLLEAHMAKIGRLERLLATARQALLNAGEEGLVFGAPVRFHDAILAALRRSDPDNAEAVR